jgi:serine/threonine protein phosphatase PrpC
MKIQYWKNVHTKQVGTSHIDKNIPCQDATNYLYNKGISVMAVADGAGSRKLSHEGSEIVVQEICNIISENFEDFFIELEETAHYDMKSLDIKKRIINHLQKKLFDYAVSHQNINVDDLASTLLFYAYSKNRYILGHIGDGIIGSLKEANQTNTIETLSFPENGSAANITFFVTNQDVLEHFRIQTGFNHQSSGFILMSDGPEEAFFDPFNGLNNNTIKLFTNFTNIEPQKYKDILDQLLKDQISKVSDDDLSLNITYLDTKEVSDDFIIELEKKLESLKETQCLYKVSSNTFRFDETFLNDITVSSDIFKIKNGIHTWGQKS